MTASIVKVAFDGGAIECARDDAGAVWITLAPICARLGDLDVSTQVRKLKEISHMARVVKMPTLRPDGREVEQWAVDLDGLAPWLMSISLRRVSAKVRPWLERLQADGARVLREHFFPEPEAAPPPALEGAPAAPPQALTEAEVRAGMAAIELALETGAIDKAGAAVRLALLVRGKVDLLALPEGVGFQRSALTPDASAALADGRPVLLLPVPDETGFERASAIGKRHGLSGQAVNDLAKAMGVHGDERYGAWRKTYGEGGKVLNTYFVYNAEGVAAVEPKVAEAGAAKRAEAEARAARATRQRGLALDR